MLCLNIQGLQIAKIHQLELDFIDYNVTFLCFSETWSNAYNFDSYYFCDHELAAYFCREKHRHGGVSIFVKKGLHFTSINLNSFCSELDFEVCGLVWRNNDIDVVLIMCYRSPTGDFKNFVDLLSDLLHYVCRMNRHIILAGDFNLHFEEQDGRCRSFLHLLSTFNLKGTVSEATRDNAILDNVFVNYSGVSSSVAPCLFSDHNYVISRCNFGSTSDVPNFSKRYGRCFNELSLMTFENALQGEVWPNFSEFHSLDEAFDKFYSTFVYHFDICFPEILLTFRESGSKNKEWLSQEVKTSSKNLRNLFQLQLKYPALKDYYLSEKKKHSVLVTKTKQHYYGKKIAFSENKSKAAWSIISALTNRHKEHPNISIEVDGAVIGEPRDVAEHFNNFFISEPLSIASRISGPRQTRTYCADRVYGSMCAFPYSEQDLLSVCCLLKSKRSSGPDGVPCWLLRRVLPTIIGPLTQLVNLSFVSGAFPRALKVSAVLPVHKKNSQLDVVNYRPISLSSSFSKIFEYAMLERLEKHLLVNKIICDRQHGFRRNHSTITAIHSFVSEIVHALEGGLRVSGVFCDLSRAFDCVGHDLLIEKLEYYGIRGIVADWFKSYLSQRIQFVKVTYKVNNVTQTFRSSTLPVTLGVPQGSILGPILFILFINDIVNFVNFSLHIYADDTSAIVLGPDLTSVGNNINSVLAELSDWFCANGLYLNINKTNFISFNTRQSNDNVVTNINLDGSPIVNQQSTRFLGLSLDENLNWAAHCESLTKKLNCSCYLVRNLKSVLSVECLLSFYYSEVHSRISYGIVFWGLSVSAQIVFLAQKRILRCIAGVGSRESCRPLFKRYGILPLPSVYILEILLYIFKNKDDFIRNSDFHNYNTRGRNDYMVPMNRINITRRAPSSVGVRLFNQLPSSIKLVSNINKFKKLVKKVLVDNSVYSIEEFSSAIGAANSMH